MSDELGKLEQRVDRLTSKLETDLEPETDLWPRIAAQLDSDAERQFGRLPREIETGRDLWPDIRAGIGERHRRRAGSGLWEFEGGIAAAAGIVAVAVLTLLLTNALRDFGPSGQVTASAGDAGLPAVEVPGWMADALAQFTGAAAGTTAAELGETAESIERDFLMVRTERFRLEQAIARSAADLNLRAQWRRVYLAELRLMDESQKLANTYGMRSEI